MSAAKKAHTVAVIEPFTFRLPPNGETDPHFGGSRTFWNAQILPNAANRNRPPVKSIVRKQPGAKRGIRFILYASAKAYFESLAQEQLATRDAA